MCLYSSSYYQNLQDKLSGSGPVIVNLFPEKKENLLHITSVSRAYFKHVVLIEFDDFQYIVQRPS